MTKSSMNNIQKSITIYEKIRSSYTSKYIFIFDRNMYFFLKNSNRVTFTDIRWKRIPFINNSRNKRRFIQFQTTFCAFLVRYSAYSTYACLEKYPLHNWVKCFCQFYKLFLAWIFFFYYIKWFNDVGKLINWATIWWVLELITLNIYII